MWLFSGVGCSCTHLQSTRPLRGLQQAPVQTSSFDVLFACDSWFSAATQAGHVCRASACRTGLVGPAPANVMGKMQGLQLISRPGGRHPPQALQPHWVCGCRSHGMCSQHCHTALPICQTLAAYHAASLGLAVEDSSVAAAASCCHTVCHNKLSGS